MTTQTFCYESGETVATLQDTGEFTIVDFFTWTKGGEVVVSLDAKFDLSDIHPENRMFILSMLVGRRMHLVGPSDEQRAKDIRRSDRYDQRKAEYDALPWYRRVFTRRPWRADAENSQ